MNTPALPSDASLPPNAEAPPDAEALRRCTRVLEALVEDRGLLAQLDEPERVAFMRAVGRVAHPDRDARARLAKADRRQEQRTRRERDRQVTATAGIRALRRAAVFLAPSLLESGGPPDSGPELETPRHCYVCKEDFRRLHFFYDSMCPPCAELNYAKRFQQASVDGKVALITGGRVKIGFQAALMLLRSGAQVIVTTRFPNDAALRFAREADASRWSDRLQIHGLDLRHAPSVELFARYLVASHPRLDILINNAAQTVRRPPGFYAHLSPMESRPWTELPSPARALLQDHAGCVAALGGGTALTPTWRSTDAALGIHASAALSQVPYVLEQEGDKAALFPQGRLDADLQQVDLRSVNSWRLTLAEVATAEMLEVHLVNAVAPFILCSKLKPLMLKDRTEPGHIVNVSAMEGSFSRGTKTDKHPHTNMAKAALNMLTLTSARDYARSHIYMNAVDTGWVTDEDPAVHAERKQKELDFQPPLDIVDGAARIVDPVFSAVRTGELVWGNFFKDYRPTDW